MLGALLVLARLLIMKSISSVLGFKIYPRVLFIYQLANWHRSFIVHIKTDLNIYKESSNLSQSIPAVTLQRLGYQLLTLHWFTTQSYLEGSFTWLLLYQGLSRSISQTCLCRYLRSMPRMSRATNKLWINSRNLTNQIQ